MAGRFRGGDQPGRGQDCGCSCGGGEELSAIQGRVTIVEDGPALCVALNRLLAETPVHADRKAPVAPQPLIEAVRSFIWADAPRGAVR